MSIAIPLFGPFCQMDSSLLLCTRGALVTGTCCPQGLLGQVTHGQVPSGLGFRLLDPGQLFYLHLIGTIVLLWAFKKKLQRC